MARGITGPRRGSLLAGAAAVMALGGLLLTGCPTRVRRAVPRPALAAAGRGPAAVPTATANASSAPHDHHTFFVAPAGSDSAPGTLERPFRTLGYALRRLRAGDRLSVRGGTYVERVKVTAATGTADAPVVVAAYAHEHPLILGELWLGEPSYWTIAGLAVSWGPADRDEPMVRIYGGTHWVLRDSTLFGSHSTSELQIDDGPRNDLGSWAVVGNCIHDTYRTHGDNQDNNLYVDDMSLSPHPSGLIEHNIIYNAPNGRGIKLGPGGSSGGPRNVVIRYNTIYNSVQNISVSQRTSNVRILRNILTNAQDANLAAFELRGTDDVAFDNVAGQAPRFVNEATSLVKLSLFANAQSAAVPFDNVSCAGFHSWVWHSFGAYG